MDGKFLIDAAAQTPLPQPFPVYQKNQPDQFCPSGALFALNRHLACNSA